MVSEGVGREAFEQHSVLNRKIVQTRREHSIGFSEATVPL